MTIEWAEYEIRRLPGVYACITTPTEVAVLVEPAGDVAAVHDGATMIMDLLGIDRTLRVMGGGPLAVPRSSLARKVPVAVGVGGLVAAALAGTVAALAGGLFGAAPAPTRVPVVPFPAVPAPLAAAPARPHQREVGPAEPLSGAAPALKGAPASFALRVAPAVARVVSPGLAITRPAVITSPAVIASPAVTAAAAPSVIGGTAPSKPAAAAIKAAEISSAPSFAAATGAGKDKADRHGADGDDRANAKGAATGDDRGDERPHGKGHGARRGGRA